MASKYYQYNFKREPDDDLRCLICLEVAEDPKQHELCGKLFCKKCIEKNGNNPCPNCRAEMPIYFQDMKSLRDIKDLCVRCDNVEKGCKWKGTVATVQDHVQTYCGFTEVLCPFECMVDGESVQIKRKDLESHKKKCPNRDYECKQCGEKGPYSAVKMHDKTCREKVVKCPNFWCFSFMERKKIEEHVRTVCGHTVVTCTYESIGCSIGKMRKDIKQHEEEDDKVHFHLALKKAEVLESTQFELDLARDKLETTQLELYLAREKIKEMEEVNYQAKLEIASEKIKQLEEKMNEQTRMAVLEGLEGAEARLNFARKEIKRLEMEKREFMKDRNSCKVS